MTRRVLRCLAVSLALGAAAYTVPSELSAQEAEEILRYDVTIRVGDGGVMNVREEIAVRALGDQVRRGIYRDVPTSFPRFLGVGRIEAPFDVRRVTRNGQPEPYSAETVGGAIGRRGMRVKIGDAAVLLDHRVHEYTIEYETSRWITFGEDSDELYWNVTGNDWSLPIRSATARVLVEGVDEPPELAAWTGLEGSTETDVEMRWDAGADEAVFETTDPLTPGEGLTIGVAFPSGLLAPPSDEEQARWTRLDWGGWIEAGYLLLVVLALYLLMWRRVGMDPPPGRLGPRDEPPAGYSPAALGFIADRGYDQRQLSAAIVDMALKGALRITETGSGWRLDKSAEADELDGPLSPEETALFGELFSSSDSVNLSRSNHATLRAAITSFRKSLATRLEREYFVNNRVWFAAGVTVSVIGFGLLAIRWRFDIHPVALFLGVWLTIWSAGVSTMAYRLVQEFRTARGGAGWGSFVGLGLFSIPFFVAEIVVGAILFFMAPPHLLVAGLALGGINVLFYHLLERPTLKGRGVLDGLRAFQDHLEGTADLAARQGSAGEARRVETFEAFLPYVIALEMDERWTDAFAAALALPSPTSRQTPFRWYHDQHGGTPVPSRVVEAVGGRLGSHFSAMSSPPSSSGGGGSGGFSSGGGSSGGGGGGGGGGGW